MTDLATRTADEPERVALWVEAYGAQPPVKELFNDIAALLRRLRNERDEARIKINELYSERDAALARIEELEKKLTRAREIADTLASDGSR
jgi:hypothetical protein